MSGRATGAATGALTAIAALTALAVGCAPAWKQAPHDRPFQQVAPPILHPMPERNSPSDWWDHALHSTVRPLARVVSPARYLAALSGGRPALDVNAFGQVADSPWFQNRIGREPWTPAQLATGPNVLGPPPDGELTVLSGKPEGVMPGLVVRDVAGTLWFVKFDPPSFPGMASSAELIASRLLFAAGYWVPETYVVELELDRLRLDPGATTRDEYNRTIQLTRRQLNVLLMQLNPDLEGRLHAILSRAVPGRPLGPFSYRGTRGDDPNDRIPHERRRSLRGLWVFQAWLNNTDTRRQNTLDTFLPGDDDESLGHVRHYLLDFGDALGAAGTREKHPFEGYEGTVDWGEMGKRALALGLSYPYWLAVQRSPYREVGIFEADVFDPARWHSMYPNPAFDEATPRDTFWAAAILARFQREHIVAAVNEAHYRKQGSADWVVSILTRRREKLLHHAFARMAPLDAPRVQRGYELVLEDLEIAGGIGHGEERSYVARVAWHRTARSDRWISQTTSAEPRFDLREAVRTLMTESAAGFRADPYLTVEVRLDRGQGPGPAVRVHLRAVRDHLIPVAVDRDVD